jgi:hypothetical protein
MVTRASDIPMVFPSLSRRAGSPHNPLHDNGPCRPDHQSVEQMAGIYARVSNHVLLTVGAVGRARRSVRRACETRPCVIRDVCLSRHRPRLETHQRVCQGRGGPSRSERSLAELGLKRLGREKLKFKTGAPIRPSILFFKPSHLVKFFGAHTSDE